MDELGEPRLVQLLRPHRGEVTCLDVAGACLATGGADRALRLWRWTGGAGWAESAAAAGAHRYGVTVARWAAAGLVLASGGVDGVARLWSRALSPRRQLLAPGAAAVRALCWTGGCARLLVGHDDGTLCVWRAPAGELLARLYLHEGSLRAVATPARDALLLTACAEGVLKVFDLAEVCARRTESDAAPTPLLWVDGAHDLGALCADASEAGAAVTGGQDGHVRMWRAVVERGRCTMQEWGTPLEGHTAAVTAVRWAAGVAGTGGETIASASLDRTARLWSAGGACLRVLHAHPRYLTCVALSPDLRYVITGSNDRTVRMWSLGNFSLEDELQPPCDLLAHFAIGDLEGIGPVDDVNPEEAESQTDSVRSAPNLVWASDEMHGGAVNCVACHRDLLATASSDGRVKIFRWDELRAELVELHALDAHTYPVLAAEFGCGGRVLLSAGLDGCAFLWDVQSGVQLRALSAASGEGCGEVGGGGARDARVSPHHPPLLLLATDDGLAPLWSLASADPQPAHVYAGHAEAVTCCAFSPDGRLLATGAASGELRLHASPPTPRTLHHEPVAHDLGVQSCDFAPRPMAIGADEGENVLATGGCDSLVKLWAVNEENARVVRQFSAHGGGVTCVRWDLGGAGTGILLASAGADGWARVWRVTAGGLKGLGSLEVHALSAVAVSGALAVALLTPSETSTLLAVGALGGGLVVWLLPGECDVSAREEGEDAGEECAAARLWGAEEVVRWLREYVTNSSNSTARALEVDLMQRVRNSGVTGARLLDDPVHLLLDQLGYGGEGEGGEAQENQSKELLERVDLRVRLQEELHWLRQLPLPPALKADAPHALLCPLSHRVLREPAAAADGFTYERAAILEWFLADDSGMSPVSGRRLASRRVRPNLGARDLLRQYLRERGEPA